MRLYSVTITAFFLCIIFCSIKDAVFFETRFERRVSEEYQSYSAKKFIAQSFKNACKQKGFENLDDIAKTPGIGGVFLGPIDLAVDMGHGVNIFHPEVVEAMDEMIRRIKALGVPVGTIAVTPEQAKHFADLGVSFLAFGADTAFLAAAADNTWETFTKDIKR